MKKVSEFGIHVSDASPADFVIRHSPFVIFLYA
jgi:hypothetical protein